MCGIGFLLGHSPVECRTLQACLAALRRRGPDFSRHVHVEVETGVALHLLAAVLHLRGESLIPQPAEDTEGNMLLWNGEVFDGLRVEPTESDTTRVLGELSRASNDREVVETLARISGPFSFVYWCPHRSTLYYGRDPVGRRSLLMRKRRTPEEPSMVLSCLPVTTTASEVAPLQSSFQQDDQGLDMSSRECRASVHPAADDWEEIGADGVYVLNLAWRTQKDAPERRHSAPAPKLHKWRDCRSFRASASGVAKISRWSALAYLERDPVVGRPSSRGVPTLDECTDGGRMDSGDEGCVRTLDDGLSAAAAGLLSRLRQSMDRRVSSIPYRPIDREGILLGHHREKLHCSREESQKDGTSKSDQHFEHLDSDLTASFEDTTDSSRDTGLDHTSLKLCESDPVIISPLCLPPARVGVLFSGGLDSVVMAAILAYAAGHESKGPLIPAGEPIDLINVCFDEPSGHTSPDRVASMVAVRELQTLFPCHLWRLVCVDASYEDVMLQKDDIWRVMQPCRTTMDFNIAAAFFFASRGVGWLYTAPSLPSSFAYASGESIEDRLDSSEAEAPEATRVDSSTKRAVSVEPTAEVSWTSSGAGDDKEYKAQGGSLDMLDGAAKVNKNKEWLCPVRGCRRLLKPGCVFGTCSRCCLKAQALLEAEEPVPAASSPHTQVANVARNGAAAIASDHQRLCKARAEEAALKALEDHLEARFPKLSRPLRVGELASLLEREAIVGCVRFGRDLHRLPPPPGSRGRRGSGSRQAQIENRSQRWTKWCPVHKARSRAAIQGHGHSVPAVEDSGGPGEIASEQVASATFTTAARVLLVGIGVDEFMGGYSRHRNTYIRGGMESLSRELLMDQERLWKRNLGRDDRCIADHGREVRCPYLDEDVVSYLRSLPMRDICDMDQPPGVGDKKILRQVAAHLGLESCCTLPKRAIQFGSRIAQHYARHVHGSHRKGSGAGAATFVGTVRGEPGSSLNLAR